jgi:Bacterial Ig domain/Bacterial Ig-like domain/LysM domain
MVIKKPLESLHLTVKGLIRRPINAYLGNSLGHGGLFPPTGRIMQKKPLALFSGIATAGVLALGFAYNVKPNWPNRDTAETVTEQVKTPEKVVEAPKPAEPEQQVAVAVQPVKTPEPAPKPEIAQAEAATVLPSFDTVRVESTGEAIIAGRAEPGAAVAVKFNGQIVGEAIANAAGEFAIIPDKKLEQGTGALTLVMTKNGAITESEGSVVISVKEDTPVMVAKVDPVEPTVVTQVPTEDQDTASKEVQLNAVDYDSAGNIVFTGRVSPGSVIRFYIDNKLAGDAEADTSGRWIFKGGEQVKAGQHTLRADQVDAAGKVLSRIELPFLRESEEVVAAVQAPVAPVVVEQPIVAQPAPETQVAVATPEVVVPPAPPRTGTKLSINQQAVPNRIVIQPGQNLWKLSRQIYGRGKLYTVIYKANKDQLRSPHRVYPGQILTAPIRKASK